MEIQYLKTKEGNMLEVEYYKENEYLEGDLGTLHLDPLVLVLRKDKTGLFIEIHNLVPKDNILSLSKKVIVNSFPDKPFHKELLLNIAIGEYNSLDFNDKILTDDNDINKYKFDLLSRISNLFKRKTRAI